MTSRDVSVIIVGAGVSGFAAAVKLIKNGFKNITILEAQARAGCRVHTVDFSEGKIDLGAQWCRGMEGNVVHELAGSESLEETSMDFMSEKLALTAVISRETQLLLNCFIIFLRCSEKICWCDAVLMRFTGNLL
jgi:monoamine oxidase